MNSSESPVVRKICLVMCSRSKRRGSAAAREFYQSARFTNDRARAEKFFDEWFIISGKYGLVEPGRIVESYDLNLDQASTIDRLYFRALIAIQMLVRFGFRAPLHVELRAKGVYRSYGMAALALIGFSPCPGGGEYSVILTRVGKEEKGCHA